MYTLTRVGLCEFVNLAEHRLNPSEGQLETSSRTVPGSSPNI